MSSPSRYYYVDAQNQAAGPIALPELQTLRASGTIQDSTLVVLEGGQDWVAYSTLSPAQPSATAQLPAPLKGAEETAQPSPSAVSTDPKWAQELLQKVDQLTRTVEKMVTALEKSVAVRTPPVAVPATATLHAEKFNPNLVPKMGIAATLGTNPAPRAPAPPGSPPNSATVLSPMAVPANAVKSPLPLPSLNVKPGMAPAPQPGAPPAKSGNLFSKFLKK
ncbi:DUF4339 domain-containing protein [bacterium]|nr:DUF4339 domain-containing protein [bacterium]